MSTDTLTPSRDAEPSVPQGAIAATPSPAAPQIVTIIERRSGWQLLDWNELHAYRDLFRFRVWRQIKVRYAQSVIGIGWAVIQPVFSMLVFTVVFGKLAKVDSDGVPYPLFSFAALVPWTYFSNAVSDGVGSLVGEANMIRKIYFPRVILPLSAVVAKLVDFTIASVCLALLLAAFQYVPTWNVVFLPLLVLMMMAAAAGVSLWLSALAVQYRDVNYSLTFALQIAMYASPVIYSVSKIPDRYRLLYALNPMVGVIDGFRSALLGTNPMPWDMIGVGAAVTSVVLTTGLIFFRSKERGFADVA